MTQLTTILTAFSMLTGLTSRYDIGVFPATVEARQSWGELSQDQIDNHDGFAAVVDCDLIGQTIYALPNNGQHWHTGELVDNGEWQRLLIADCAVRDDSDGAKSWMLDNNILIEIDGELAQSYGYTHQGVLPVVISTVPPMFDAYESGG